MRYGTFTPDFVCFNKSIKRSHNHLPCYAEFLCKLSLRNRWIFPNQFENRIRAFIDFGTFFGTNIGTSFGTFGCIIIQIRQNQREVIIVGNEG